MKNFIYSLLGIMVVSFMIGAILAKQGGGISLETTDINESQSIPAAGVKDLEIKTKGDNIIVNSDDNASDITARLEGKIASKNVDTKLKVTTDQATGFTKIEIDKPGPRFFIVYYEVKLYVTIPKNYVGEIALNSTSGKINIENITNPMNVNTTSGKVTARLASVPNDINFTSTSGNVEVKLPKEANYSFKFNTLSGKFDNLTDSVFSRSSHRTYEGKTGETSNTIDISTTSGSFTLSN